MKQSSLSMPMKILGFIVGMLLPLDVILTLTLMHVLFPEINRASLWLGFFSLVFIAVWVKKRYSKSTTQTERETESVTPTFFDIHIKSVFVIALMIFIALVYAIVSAI